MVVVAAWLAPVLGNFGMEVSTDTSGLVLWSLAALLLLVRLARGAEPRTWLGLGQCWV